jgi:hypothetical protein
MKTLKQIKKDLLEIDNIIEIKRDIIIQSDIYNKKELQGELFNIQCKLTDARKTIENYQKLLNE